MSIQTQHDGYDSEKQSTPVLLSANISLVKVTDGRQRFFQHSGHGGRVRGVSLKQQIQHRWIVGVVFLQLLPACNNDSIMIRSNGSPSQTNFCPCIKKNPPPPSFPVRQLETEFIRFVQLFFSLDSFPSPSSLPPLSFPLLSLS